MKNYINKNIDTSVRWNRESKKIIGLSIFDKKQIKGRHSPKSWSDTKDFNAPTGYCGSIELSNDNLQIWTNGNYQFIEKKIAVKLLEELLKRLKSK